MRARWLLAALVVCAPLVDAAPARARLGGGQHYSGGSSHSSPSHSSPSRSSSRSYTPSSSSSRRSSSTSPRSTSSARRSSTDGSYAYGGAGGGDSAFGWDWLFLILAIGLVLGVFKWIKDARARGYESAAPRPRPVPASSVVRQLRAVDPSFSEPVFLEWAQLLFTRFHEARGSKDLSAVLPYLGEHVVEGMGAGPEGKPVTDVRGVVIGHSRLERAQVSDLVRLDVVFRANWTSTWSNGREQAYYVEEVWTFSRLARARSRTPENVERLGCPGCGSAAERSSLGRCPHCGGSLVPGEADWCVAARYEREVTSRPPLLTGVVEEVGTDLQTVKELRLVPELQALQNFTPSRFSERARHVFFSLQSAWSQGRLEGLRPNETDALFSQHRFWVEEYARQGLRNVLDDVRLLRMEPCKVDSDKFYDALTCRMWASAKDYTVRLADRSVVAGQPKAERHFTEYWTFIRRRGVQTAGTDVQCPSCMAALSVTQTGVCTYCGTKLTRGDFDWVLSRIEQDEEYIG
jgi:predicted lipid-binding transport protein (Tim44 family)